MPAMLAVLIKLFANRRALTVGCVGLVALALAVQTLRLDHLKRSLASAEAALKDPATGKTWRAEAVASERDRQICANAIEQQNTAIALFRDASARATANADLALATTRREGSRNRQNAEAILAARPGSDVCAGADALILGSLNSEALP